jgi:hypothetical protein
VKGEMRNNREKKERCEESLRDLKTEKVRRDEKGRQRKR